MRWHRRGFAPVLAGALLWAPAACSSADGTTDVPTTSAPAAVTASPTPDASSAAPADAGSPIDRYVGQQWRLTDSGGEDASYFIMQPGGALTWFNYHPDVWDQYDDNTWVANGDRVTFVVNEVSTWTGTLAGDKLTGTAVGDDGKTYTWEAKPAAGDKVP